MCYHCYLNCRVLHSLLRSAIPATAWLLVLVVIRLCLRRSCTFPMYTNTTPLSRPTLIFTLSLNHHLFADDTQLFSHSILVILINSSIAHLETALQQISFFLLLTIETEFFIIGLKQQLSKISCHLKDVSPHLVPNTLYPY